MSGKGSAISKDRQKVKRALLAYCRCLRTHLRRSSSRNVPMLRLQRLHRLKQAQTLLSAFGGSSQGITGH